MRLGSSSSSCAPEGVFLAMPMLGEELEDNDSVKMLLMLIDDDDITASSFFNAAM